MAEERAETGQGCRPASANARHACTPRVRACGGRRKPAPGKSEPGRRPAGQQPPWSAACTRGTCASGSAVCLAWQGAQGSFGCPDALVYAAQPASCPRASIIICPCARPEALWAAPAAVMRAIRLSSCGIVGGPGFPRVKSFWQTCQHHRHTFCRRLLQRSAPPHTPEPAAGSVPCSTTLATGYRGLRVALPHPQTAANPCHCAQACVDWRLVLVA